MSRVVFAIVVVAVALASASSRAQTVPLSAATPSLDIGVDHLAGPVARLGLSPGGNALVVGRVDVGARVVGVVFGGQWQQRLWGPLSLREAATIGPFVSALGPPAGGVAADALLQLGIDVGDVLLLLGPRLQGNALIQGAAPGRGALEAVVGVKVPLGNTLAVTASASAGAERSHVGLVPGAGALAGSLSVGVQWRP